MNPRCPTCHEEMQDGLTELRYNHAKTQVLISEVPAKVCSSGHAVIQGELAMDLDEYVQDFYVNIHSVRTAHKTT